MFTHRPLARALICGLGLVLGACSPGTDLVEIPDQPVPSNPTWPTADAGTDGGGPDGSDPQGCCAGVTCDRGSVCSPSTCDCVEMEGQCGAVGEGCEPNLVQSDPFICVAYGEGYGICRIACVGPAVGTSDTCAEGVCGALPEQEGYCLPDDCPGYFANTCGPDATCLPTLGDEGACVPDGPGDMDSPCELHNDCGHDLLCIGGLCTAPDCTVDSNVVPCGASSTCAPMTVDAQPLSVGTCVNTCAVFAEEDCDGDTWCYPLFEPPDEEEDIAGYCTDIWGDLGLNDSCQDDPGGCQPGLTCVQSGPSAAYCERLCTPDAIEPNGAGACGWGMGCVPLLLTNDSGGLLHVLGFGTCVSSCVPWVDVTQSGCGFDTWCVPATFNASIGQCTGLVGVREEGDACNEETPESTCAPGLLCMNGGGGIGASTCRRLCNPEAPSPCAGGLPCLELIFESVLGDLFGTGTGICALP